MARTKDAWMIQRDNHPRLWKSVLIIPKGFTAEAIQLEYEKLLRNEVIKPIASFNPEHVLAMADLIVRTIIYSNFPEKENISQSHGIHSDKLKREVNSNYNKYLPFIDQLADFQRDSGYQTGYFSKKYRFDFILEKSIDQLDLHYIKSNSRLKSLSKEKASRLTEIQKQVEAESHRRRLIKDVLAIGLELDAEEMRNHLTRSEDRSKAFNAYFMLVRLKFGYYYGNAKDSFGNRFHSPFTNTPSSFRSHLKIAGEPVSEVDIKNSQFYFLANLNNEGVLNLLEPIWDHPLTLNEIMLEYDSLRSESDFQEFLSHSQRGTLYEFLQDKLKFKDRTSAKKWIMEYMFSDSRIYKNRDQKLRKHKMDSLIQLRKNLNHSELKTIPKLLQTLESFLIIDNVVPKIIDQELGRILTVHDSVICQQLHAERITKIIHEVFNENGLSEPKIDIK